MIKYFVVFLVLAMSLVAQWEVVDSVSFTIRIPANDNCYIYCDYMAESLCVVKPPGDVIQTAQDAVACAPDWLKTELEDNFSRLDSAYQNLYADVILNTPAPYIDEVAFCIAHLAPQTLTNYSFDPELILFNAEVLYANDDSLDYVRIIDYPGSSFYSTTSYFVAESTGTGVDTFELELPKEIYYWFIVHPKLHKELPGYIDPNTGNPSPTGFFWRDYLFNHADTGYPLLCDSLKGIKTLWNSRKNSLNNGAVGRVTDWIQDVMVFQSYPHHDQPVRIYHLHIGTCSVHSYLTAGTSRASLIPAVVTVAYRNNHKWNEFYDRRWIQWEPVNTFVDNTTTYETWGSIGHFRGIFDWRGDANVWTMTERYTPVCTLKVYVSDAQANPVDGARIIIDGPGSPGPWATVGWTTSSGDCQFLLGDSVSYFTGAVQSSIGNISTTTIINNSQPNVTYYWNPVLSGTIDQLKARSDTLPSSPLDDYKFEYTAEVSNEILYGTNPIDGNTFSDFSDAGNIDFFICDQVNFAAYTAGDSFYAFQIIEDVSSLDSSFTLPTDEDWYLVLSNEDQVVNKAVANITVRLLKDITGIAEAVGKRQSGGLHITPNPATDHVEFSCSLAKRGHVCLKIYDVQGRLIDNLLTGRKEKGIHTVVWNTRGLSSGVYFVRYQSEESEQMHKVVLLH
jgi:hypothetical protein